MLMARLRRWLADVISPDTRTVVVPGEHCAHAASANPEVTVRRLLTSVTSAEHFVDQLAKFVDCGDCSASVIWYLTGELAGTLLDADSDEDATATPPICTCARPVNAAAMVLRLSLGYDSHDDHSLGQALGEIGCTYCMLAVIVAAITAHVETLSDVHVGWRLSSERLLMSMLDEAAT